MKYQFLFQNSNKIGIFKYILEYSNEAKMYDLKSFFKFAFIRNPYDRSISCIYYLYGCALRNGIEFPDNLDDFVNLCINNDYFHGHFMLSQSESLKDDEGKIDFQFIGKFENLMGDLKKVMVDILGYELKPFDKVHINASDKSAIVLNRDFVYELTEKLHKEDFETFKFNYK
jgi:hypothetical protein